MKLNIRLVECFRAVMMARTVTAAAEMLNTSQPAISRSIQQLESALGLKLFERDKGRLVPTAQAHSFFEEVNKSFIGLDHLARVAANLRSYQSGSVSLVCSAAFANGFIAAAAKRFADQHSALSLTVETQLASTIAELVSTQRFDLGLAAYWLAPPAADAELYCEADEVCILPPGHALGAKSVITPEDFRGTRFVFLSGNDPYRIRLDRVFEEAGVQRDLVIETRNTSTACSLVQQGAGVSIVNRLTAVEYLPGGLVMRRFSVSLPFTTTLLRAKFRPSSPVVDLFVRELYTVRDQHLLLADRALG